MPLGPFDIATSWKYVNCLRIVFLAFLIKIFVLTVGLPRSLRRDLRGWHTVWYMLYNCEDQLPYFCLCYLVLALVPLRLKNCYILH